MRDTAKFLVRFAAIPAVALFSVANAVEVPRRAEEFVDSIGINTHIDVSSTVYNEPVIGQSGIRHFRSNVKPGMTTLYARLASLYANYGSHVDLVCDTTSVTPWQYQSLARDPMFESVEGLNEPDSAGPRSYAGLSDSVTGNSYPATMQFQRDLFNAMNSDGVTLAKDVLSPAMANPANSAFLQGIAAEYVAMHSYPAQQMPTGNFLTSYFIPNAQAMAGATPMRLMATETGYRSGSAWGDISMTAATKYAPRLYAEYFRLGMAKTFLFEMNDTGMYNYGLLDANFHPKPEYYEVQNLIRLLSESYWNSGTQSWVTPGSFYPASVDYTMTSPSTNVHHILLQKSNGKIYLILWQEVPSFDLAGVVDIPNPTVPVDLTFNLGIATASVYTLGSNTPQATYNNVATLRVNVPDELMILELTPGVMTSFASGGQVASINTTVANTSVAAGQPGMVNVSRSGSTASPLTVYYTTSGTAIAGGDYDPLPGYVTIPAGSNTATIVVNPRNAAIVGRKNLVLTLNVDSSYGISTSRSASVFFGASRTTISDFNSGLGGWHGNAGASTSWTTSTVDTGGGAMKVDMYVDGVNRWINNFEMNFASAQDWTAVSKLVLRVAEGSGNPSSNLGKPIYFTWFNNGVPVGGGFGAAKFPLTLDSNYHTITLDLGNLPRDHVTGLFFYADASVLQPATDTLFIDNVTAITDTNGVLDDFEEWGVSNWSHGSQSWIDLEQGVVDTGVHSLKWTFTNSTVRWDNYVKLDFQLPADLSQYSTLRFRIKTDSNNPTSDSGVKMFVDWFNNGARANGNAGLASFSLQPAGDYYTVEVPISAFKRDSINSIFWYVDGASLAGGRHYWYLDNITAY